MNTGNNRATARKIRQDNRRDWVATHHKEVLKSDPVACENFIIFGGKLTNRVREENNKILGHSKRQKRRIHAYQKRREERKRIMGEIMVQRAKYKAKVKAKMERISSRIQKLNPFRRQQA